MTIADDLRSRAYAAQLRARCLYSEDQPRDDHGRWEGGGGDGRSAWEENLEPRERTALEDWSVSRWEEIQQAQRIGNAAGPRAVERAAMFAAALEKAPQHDGTVYRGLRDMKAADKKQLLSSGTVTLKNDQSASKDKDIALGAITKDKTGVLLVIDGRSGRDISSVTDKSAITPQSEVVVRKGATYDVIAHSQDHSGLLTVHLRER